MEAARGAPLSASPPGRSCAVLVVLLPGEGAPPVSDPSVDSSLEDEESLEVFIVPSSREECNVHPVDVYEALPGHTCCTVRGKNARSGRAPQALLRPWAPTQTPVLTMTFSLFTY
jgi:hypothetical protein